MINHEPVINRGFFSPSVVCASAETLGDVFDALVLVEYALRLILTYGNELCSALGGWLESASFVCVCVAVSAV